MVGCMFCLASWDLLSQSRITGLVNRTKLITRSRIDRDRRIRVTLQEGRQTD
jgi:hypothetical protein